MAWSERVVVRDGVRLVCRDWGGDGPPVLMLHGLAGHAGEWDRLAEGLGGQHRIVALDQRGHGASERRPREVTRAACTADVIAVIDQLDLEKVVLAGQSLGGHTAMLAAAAAPDRVRGLVLVESGAGGPSTNAAANIGNWLDSWQLPFKTRDSAVQFLGGGAIGEGWAAGLEQRDDGWWPRFDRDMMVDSIAELDERDFWAEWEGVTCPTLLVLAQHSFIPLDEVDGMLRRRPETTAVSIPGTRHDLHLQQPDVLLDRVSDFLSRLDHADG
ncbi:MULTISPECIES: alpha/beta fold hydrolase [Streptacidiphilus]|uniref:Alpha/beta fold hydrolase n=1 Tax=Streptacidiphilus cavernicola TaxID=3342716 RepID=A0ABV6UPQ1_9ACTN|nr:alpha/beta hydrolase [Streptacidiphilus jeojiense]